MNIYTKEKSEPLEKKLQGFYKKIGKSFEPPYDIFQYSSDLGFAVWKIPLEEEKLDGLIIVDEENDKLIALNHLLNLPDARFVLAHELGHYIEKFMANGSEQLLLAEKDRFSHGDEKQPIEHDMDYLAAAMLVPKDKFIADLKSYSFDFNKFIDKDAQKWKHNIPTQMVRDLAVKYCVEDAVIERRIIEVSYYV